MLEGETLGDVEVVSGSVTGAVGTVEIVVVVVGPGTVVTTEVVGSVLTVTSCFTS